MNTLDLHPLGLGQRLERIGRPRRDDGAGEVEGPEGVLMLAMAAVMELVLGPVLSTPQYFVLRRSVSRACTWIGANAFAWAVGMVVIFVGAGTLSAESGVMQIVETMALACFAAGAVVGAIHGLFLRRLLSGRGGNLTTAAGGTV